MAIKPKLTRESVSNLASEAPVKSKYACAVKLAPRIEKQATCN